MTTLLQGYMQLALGHLRHAEYLNTPRYADGLVLLTELEETLQRKISKSHTECLKVGLMRKIKKKFQLVGETVNNEHKGNT